MVLIYSSYGGSNYLVLSYSLQFPTPFVKACKLVEIMIKLLCACLIISGRDTKLPGVDLINRLGAYIIFAPRQLQRVIDKQHLCGAKYYIKPSEAYITEDSTPYNRRQRAKISAKCAPRGYYCTNNVLVLT